VNVRSRPLAPREIPKRQHQAHVARTSRMIAAMCSHLFGEERSRTGVEIVVRNDDRIADSFLR